jgi:pimeloyl-ACP methyl ester carboxylesterase
MTQASTPETHYAKTVDGVHIAYAVAGQGPVDLVVMASGLGLGEIWRGKRTGSFLRRLASFSRLIVIDRRGTGLSDHLVQEHQLSLENRMEDVRAVMDEIGSSRAVLLGLEVGGFTVAAMFAATLPERTAGLIAYGATARERWAPDYPSASPRRRSLRRTSERWPTRGAAKSSRLNGWTASTRGRTMTRSTSRISPP